MPINITMPALSPTMTEGTLAKWIKFEGDAVESGDVIAEIETDKATMEVEAVDDGILGKIIIPAGSHNIPVNEVIAVLLEDGESVGDIDNMSITAHDTPSKQEKPPSKDNTVSAQSTQPMQQSQGATNTKKRVLASPLAKRLAKDAKIDLANIKGTGPRGRIIKSDIEQAKKSPNKAIAAPVQHETLTYDDPDLKINMFGMTYKEIPNNNIRKVVAKRLSESKQEIPHFYLSIDCVLDNLLAARKELNGKANEKYKLSVNDFIMKAVAMALKSYPLANVSWSEDAVHQYIKSDVCVAVSTPHGLITPIVKAAEDKGLKQISAEIKDLAARARENKLKPDEFQGGSFTVSNLGMYGVKSFSPIINPPQGCILAVGAGEQRPVVDNGEIKIKTVMSCTLSVDHRCVDGSVGAEYLQIFKQYIENPVSMLL